jgi:hypothetical protein
LIGPHLAHLTQQLTSDETTDRQSACQHAHLMALAGRLLQNGGWVGGERVAAAEPLLTHRARPYDESTLRKSARALSARGAVAAAEQVLERQVQKAVGSADVAAFTDVHDQVYWTKKLAWAAPVGNLGNRRLGCTYFGLTFVRSETGPCLAYHVSWHKPATPLRDTVEALHQSEARHRWLSAHVAVHVLDRGTQGDPMLRWMLAQGIPYLTLTNGSVHWRRYRHPDHHTSLDVPIFVRPDLRLNDAPGSSMGQAIAPRHILFPAHPDQGLEGGRALRYRTAADLSDEAIEQLDQTYKQRWPNNENPIKDLLAVGFGRNLDRTLDPTTSRGHDGQVARLTGQLDAHDQTLARLASQPLTEALELLRAKSATKPVRAVWKPSVAEQKKRASKQEKLDRQQATPEIKGSRADRGGEHLCKVLTALVWNALALILWKSPVAWVQTMSVARVCQLLVRCSALAVVEKGRVTLWVEAVGTEEDQADQEEVVRLVNEARLEAGGSRLEMKIRDPAGKSRLLRVAA